MDKLEKKLQVVAVSIVQNRLVKLNLREIEEIKPKVTPIAKTDEEKVVQGMLMATQKMLPTLSLVPPIETTLYLKPNEYLKIGRPTVGEELILTLCGLRR